jgi:hypothetical protein
VNKQAVTQPCHQQDKDNSFQPGKEKQKERTEDPLLQGLPAA